MHTTKDAREVLAELRQAGQDPDQALLDRVKALGPAAVRPLIEMATDESLHGAETESPEVWAPLHAIQILGELGAAEAVEPLLPLLAQDDEWLDELLPECLGRIGRPALASLRVYLFDRTHDVWARERAAGALTKIVQHHPELRSDVVDALVARLDPAETQAALREHTFRERVLADIEGGRRAGVHATPTFFVDGERLDRPWRELPQIVRASLATA